MYASHVFDRVSVEDYLKGERDADLRHEYVHGYIYAMAGSSPAHNLIAQNISRAFGNALEDSPFVVYASDMKVRADGAVFYYPDVMIVCDNDLTSYYQDHPCVIVEVMSESTARKYLHEKRFVYQTLESLPLYLMVDSRTHQVFGFYRTPAGWEERAFGVGQPILIPRADIKLTHEQIYAETELSV